MFWGRIILCGIAGKFDFNGEVVDRTLIHNMCNTIVYRGPDAEGIHTAPYIGLGQRRLSIIDLRDDANPPLANEDQSIWVVFNGEIYNFKELRSELLEKGHIFRTATDTEVIVHLYEEYGADCLSRMRGMFAFAIWDSNKKVLFAARDRLGKKPFFYTQTNSSFVFGSEIKVITADPEISSSPNFAAIDSYLSRQYVPSPLTAFSNIFKLPPGHSLLCDCHGRVEVKRYWAPPIVKKSTDPKEVIVEELLRRLKESIRLRLISDVPLGAFLSGGIDSGVIVALMAMESSRPVKTFSIGFEDEDFNELPYARQVAERYETEHHEFIVKPSVIDILPTLVRHYNEPFADSSAIPTYYVSQMARTHVTVALSGDGGDENFGGYNHYAQTLRWERANAVPLPIRKLLFGMMGSAIDSFPYTNGAAKVSRALHMIASQLPERYLLQTSIMKDQEKQACYSPYFNSLINEADHRQLTTSLPWEKTMDSLDWMMRHDQSFYLPDCLMVKADIASMANSLELRAPFLDHEVVEFAASIPSFMKRNASGGKLILKEIAKKLLPEDVLNKRKTGFVAPLSKWLKNDLSDILKATLLDEIASRRGLFDQKFIKRMINEQISGTRDWSNRLWALMFLELWFREFID